VRTRSWRPWAQAAWARSTARPTRSSIASRRGVVRWGDRILLVDTTAERITTLVAGFNRDGGILRVSADDRWLYMLDSKDEGDLWMASRDLSPPRPASWPTWSSSVGTR
jgi:hypothetical protein